MWAMTCSMHGKGEQAGLRRGCWILMLAQGHDLLQGTK